MTDVVVVGHGLVGVVLARCLAEAGASVLLLEGGTPVARPAGTHLRNLPLCRADRSYLAALVQVHLRPLSVPRAGARPFGVTVPPMPAGNGVNPAQRPAANMAGARVTGTFGGMGALWSCVAPRLHPELEDWPGIPALEWQRLYRRAERLLAVAPVRTGAAAEHLLQQLADRGARPAPIAYGPRGWTGPAEVLAGADVAVRHLVARRIRHRAGEVLGVDAVDPGTGAEHRFDAGTVVVAAGATRSPALLWASGIGRDDDSALGRYLTDHPLSHARVVLDPARLGGAPPGPDPCVIVPIAAGRPFHALLLVEAVDAAALEGTVDDRLILSLYWYGCAEPQRESRITFSDRTRDSFGLPQPTMAHVPEPTGRRQAVLADLREVAAQLGPVLPGAPPRTLAAGSSMHITGTTRAGTADDGTSVVDDHGQVWGFGNLFLAGTGLLPGATATNPTLAACALAVRTADRIVGRLPSRRCT